MKKIKVTFWIIGFGCGVMVTAMVSILLALNLTKSYDVTDLKAEPIVIADESSDETIKQENQLDNIKNEEDINIISEPLDQVETQDSKQDPITNKETKKADKTQETCQITITDDLSGQDICNLLEEKGLVDDGEAFRHYIWSQNKQRSLHSGTLTLPYGLSYEELLSWLTT